LAKQVSLGVLPACLLANAVPDRIQFWLNIVFALGRKKRPGGNFRERPGTGQILPHKEILAGQQAAITSTFHQRRVTQAAQRLEKLWFTPAQANMNKCKDSASVRAMQPSISTLPQGEGA